MIIFFEILAAAALLAALVAFAPRKPKRPVGAVLLPYFASFFIYAVASLAATIRGAAEAGPFIEGYGLGLLVAVGASLIPAANATGQPGPTRTQCLSAFYWAGVAVGWLHWSHDSVPAATQLSLLVGCGITALVFDITDGSMASLATLVLAAMVSGDTLGQPVLKAFGTGFGSWAWQKALPIFIFAWVIDAGGKGWLKKAAPLFWVALLGCTGWLIADKRPELAEVVKLFPIACVAGLAVHWMMPADGETSTLRLALATVIWCSLATLAFGMMKSLGVALALAGATYTLLLLANPRALVSIAPLAILALYRVFRTVNADANQAIDIGQHYALIGFTIGIVAVTLPLEWLRTHPHAEGRRAMVGMVVWALISLAMPALVAMMLGERGLIGFLVGLGLSPLIVGWSGTRSLSVLSLSIGIGGLTIAVYGWLTGFLDLARDVKIRDFEYAAAAIIVVGIVLSLLAKPKPVEATS